jgi:hypothetical protein
MIQPQLSGARHAEFVICDQSIEECFRNMKNLLGLEKLMNQPSAYMEKMVALIMLAYAIGLWLGEALRDSLFPADNRKRKLYSGLFIFLKLKLDFSHHNFVAISSRSLATFAILITNVRS